MQWQGQRKKGPNAMARARARARDFE